MSSLNRVALEAGVSPSLVSRVLSNRMGNVRISADKRRRIQEVSKQLGYVPARLAQGLARRRAGTLALITPESTEPTRSDAWNSHYLYQILAGIELECSPAGYYCLLSHWSFDAEGLSHPRPMLDKSVDGVVLADFTRGGVVCDLISVGLPCVQIGSNIESSVPIDRYYGDAKSAMRQVGEHLARLGHQRILLLGGTGPGPREIMDAFVEAGGGRAGDSLSGVLFQSRILPVSGSAVVELAAEMARDSRAGATAFCFLSAPAAINFAQAMAGRGLVCPRDFSLVSMTTEGWPTIYLPGSGAALATVELPNLRAARAAARDLLKRIGLQEDEGSAEPPRAHLFPCRIEWGQSVSAARKE